MFSPLIQMLFQSMPSIELSSLLNDDHIPASTWANISSLATPQILIEVEVIAAKELAAIDN